MNQVVSVINDSINPLPTYAKFGDSGVDLHANEDVVVSVGTPTLIKTGLRVAIPVGYEIQIRSRSGCALKDGVFVLNSPGTVDSGYRNEIGVILFSTMKDITIKKGDRIAQAVLCPVMKIVWEEVLELPESDRGLNGFGSSGI